MSIFPFAASSLARMTHQLLIATHFLFLILLPGNAWSDHPTMSVGSGMAGPINTLPAETLTKGQWTAGFRYEYLKMDALSDNKLAQLSDEGESVHSTDSLSSQSLSMAYGVTNDFMLVGNLPYVSRRNIRETAGHHDDDEESGVVKLGDSKGIGDASLYGLYRFVNNEQTGLQVSAMGGLKMPTGDTKEKTKEGDRFEAEHQPGSGSWDPLFGFGVSRPWNSTSLSASLFYQVSTEGTQDTIIGDGVFYSLALAHRLGSVNSHNHHDHGPHREWDLILELNGEWREKVDIDGARDDNTGGHVLFLAPGIRYAASQGWAAALSFGVPVIKNLNGIQSKPDWHVIGNIGYAF
jgi:hypothetical protein